MASRNIYGGLWYQLCICRHRSCVQTWSKIKFVVQSERVCIWELIMVMSTSWHRLSLCTSVLSQFEFVQLGRLPLFFIYFYDDNTDDFSFLSQFPRLLFILVLSYDFYAGHTVCESRERAKIEIGLLKCSKSILAQGGKIFLKFQCKTYPMWDVGVNSTSYLHLLNSIRFNPT